MALVPFEKKPRNAGGAFVLFLNARLAVRRGGAFTGLALRFLEICGIGIGARRALRRDHTFFCLCVQVELGRGFFPGFGVEFLAAFSAFGPVSCTM